MSKKTPTINVVVANAERTSTSYSWKMWWHGVSFYLVPRYAPVSGVKVSLHGPDEFHATPGYRIDKDPAATARATAAGGVVYAPPGGLWFEGREVDEGVRHVITMRWTPGLFGKSKPSGPRPGEVETGSLGLILKAPPHGYATDLDIYVSKGRPWWRDEERARRDNAVVGPLINKAGDNLTAVAVKRSQKVKPTPSLTRLVLPEDKNDRRRAVGTAVDDESVLWIVEQWTSLKTLRATRP